MVQQEQKELQLEARGAQQPQNPSPRPKCTASGGAIPGVATAHWMLLCSPYLQLQLLFPLLPVLHCFRWVGRQWGRGEGKEASVKHLPLVARGADQHQEQPFERKDADMYSQEKFCTVDSKLSGHFCTPE